jgi:pSer/pThr/pTyr-binding forkhead associated (FHA) protein
VATLRRLKDGALFPLPAQCILGRSASCTLRLEETFASQEHAKISWTGSEWALRDLGSRNGTFLDQRRLDPGALYGLHEGARIGFGEEEPRWIVSDATAPGALAIELATGVVRAAIGDVLLLPDETSAELSIYPARNRTTWLVEDNEGRSRALADQETITVLGRAFRVELPVASEQTPLFQEPVSLEKISLVFEVSSDEERVSAAIVHRGQATRLEAREHLYLLLTLARLRREDASLPEAERGWRTLEQLSKMLRMKLSALNVATHRARQQLAAAGVEGAAGIIVSRDGRRRIGTDRFEIITGVDR